MELRRLDPLEEMSLYAQAFEWGQMSPRWLREANGAFGTTDFCEFVLCALADDQIDIGVFEYGRLVGLISLVLRAPGVFEVYLRARRGTKVETLAVAARSVRDGLFMDGRLRVGEIFAFVASFNAPVLEVCRGCGLSADGVTVLRGESRGRVIEWLRVSTNRERWEQENGQEKDFYATAN